MFSETSAEVAGEVLFAFNTEDEQQLIWIVRFASALGIALIFALQFVIVLPLLRGIVSPLVKLGQLVGNQGPEAVASSSLLQTQSRITEVSDLYRGFTRFASRLQQYKEEIVSATRFETIANTVQIIAHDLKSPLTVFERIINAPESDFVTYRDSMKSALNQLFSMAESIKKAELDAIVRPLDSALPLAEWQVALESFALKHELQWSFDATKVDNIAVDLQKISRSISNLIKNACEAASSLVTLAISSDGRMAQIRIEDDGPGVPDMLLKQLFSKGASFGKSDGSGLGLYYAKYVALGHGGDLVYERSNSITSFTFTIPLHFKNSLSGSEPPHSVGRKIDPEKSRKLFLLVSADSGRRSRLSELLRGFAVDIVDHVGGHAACLENSYEYILSDDPEALLLFLPIRNSILFDQDDEDVKIVNMIRKFVER